MTDPRERIVFIHPGALGDLVIAAHAVAAVRNSRIGWTVDSFTRRNVWGAFKLVDSWTNLESSRIHTLFGEPDEDVIGQAAIAVSWMGASDDRFVENLRKCTGAEVIAAPSRPSGEIHALDHLMTTIKDVAPSPAPTSLDYSPTLTARSEAGAMLAGLGIRDPSSTLAVHPGSGSPRKNWPPEYFAEIIQRWRGRDGEAVLISGPADDEPVTEVLRLAGHIPVAATPKLDVLAALLHSCRAYVGNDSGVTHLAAATGIRTVALFGPTDPRIWKPLGKSVIIIEGSWDWETGGEIDSRTLAVNRRIDDGAVSKVMEALLIEMGE